jgi:hypothetical protein
VAKKKRCVLVSIRSSRIPNIITRTNPWNQKLFSGHMTIINTDKNYFWAYFISFTLYTCLYWTLFYVEKKFKDTKCTSSINKQLYCMKASSRYPFLSCYSTLHAVTDDVFTSFLNMPYRNWIYILLISICLIVFCMILKSDF